MQSIIVNKREAAIISSALHAEGIVIQSMTIDEGLAELVVERHYKTRRVLLGLGFWFTLVRDQ
jgi:hypothetical protein